MASLVYNSAIRDAVTGAIDFDTDTFKMLLVTSTYTAVKSHDKRDDITNEVSGTGYTAGGNACSVSVAAVDNTNNDVEISFTVTSWTSATITARAGVIYKSRGGASSADELVGYVDFGSDVSSTNGTFAVTVSSPLKFQN
jgi:hypothetical protein